MARLVTTPEGFYLLNIGCGTHHHPEWNNIDSTRYAGVHRWDVRRPLLYPSECFDAVYGSHILEHLAPDVGKRMVADLKRVLRPGGTIRLVVPDLERICREFLARLQDADQHPTTQNIRRYEWITLELLDQMVREKPGGLMLEALRSGRVDQEYVRARVGEELASLCEPLPCSFQNVSSSVSARFYARLRQSLQGLRRTLQHMRASHQDPRKTGEVHRWMYDRVSLRLLLQEAGYEGFSIRTFQESEIPSWERYQLDADASGQAARIPGSIFVEARKSPQPSPRPRGLDSETRDPEKADHHTSCRR